MKDTTPKIDTIEVYKTYLLRYGNNYDALVALSADGLGPLFFSHCETPPGELFDEFEIDKETLIKAHWVPWNGEDNGSK